MNQFQTEKILGYSVVSYTPAQCIEQVCAWLATDKAQKVFVCANPHSLMLAKDLSDFQENMLRSFL